MGIPFSRFVQLWGILDLVRPKAFKDKENDPSLYQFRVRMTVYTLTLYAGLSFACLLYFWLTRSIVHKEVDLISYDDFLSAITYWGVEQGEAYLDCPCQFHGAAITPFMSAFLPEDSVPEKFSTVEDTPYAAVLADFHHELNATLYLESKLLNETVRIVAEQIFPYAMSCMQSAILSIPNLPIPLELSSREDMYDYFHEEISLACFQEMESLVFNRHIYHVVENDIMC
jgi:hypothetical protein